MEGEPQYLRGLGLREHINYSCNEISPGHAIHSGNFRHEIKNTDQQMQSTLTLGTSNCYGYSQGLNTDLLLSNACSQNIESLPTVDFRGRNDPRTTNVTFYRPLNYQTVSCHLVPESSSVHYNQERNCRPPDLSSNGTQRLSLLQAELTKANAVTSSDNRGSNVLPLWRGGSVEGNLFDKSNCYTLPSRVQDESTLSKSLQSLALTSGNSSNSLNQNLRLFFAEGGPNETVCQSKENFFQPGNWPISTLNQYLRSSGSGTHSFPLYQKPVTGNTLSDTWCVARQTDGEWQFPGYSRSFSSEFEQAANHYIPSLDRSDSYQGQQYPDFVSCDKVPITTFHNVNPSSSTPVTSNCLSQTYQVSTVNPLCGPVESNVLSQDRALVVQHFPNRTRLQVTSQPVNRIPVSTNFSQTFIQQYPGTHRGPSAISTSFDLTGKQVEPNGVVGFGSNVQPGNYFASGQNQVQQTATQPYRFVRPYLQNSCDQRGYPDKDNGPIIWQPYNAQITKFGSQGPSYCQLRAPSQFCPQSRPYTTIPPQIRPPLLQLYDPRCNPEHVFHSRTGLHGGLTQMGQNLQGINVEGEFSQSIVSSLGNLGNLSPSNENAPSDGSSSVQRNSQSPDAGRGSLFSKTELLKEKIANAFAGNPADQSEDNQNKEEVQNESQSTFMPNVGALPTRISPSFRRLRRSNTFDQSTFFTSKDKPRSGSLNTHTPPGRFMSVSSDVGLQNRHSVPVPVCSVAIPLPPPDYNRGVQVQASNLPQTVSKASPSLHPNVFNSEQAVGVTSLGLPGGSPGHVGGQGGTRFVATGNAKSRDIRCSSDGNQLSLSNANQNTSYHASNQSATSDPLGLEQTLTDNVAGGRADFRPQPSISGSVQQYAYPNVTTQSIGQKQDHEGLHYVVGEIPPQTGALAMSSQQGTIANQNMYQPKAVASFSLQTSPQIHSTVSNTFTGYHHACQNMNTLNPKQDSGRKMLTQGGTVANMQSVANSPERRFLESDNQGQNHQPLLRQLCTANVALENSPKGRMSRQGSVGSNNPIHSSSVLTHTHGAASPMTQLPTDVLQRHLGMCSVGTQPQNIHAPSTNELRFRQTREGGVPQHYNSPQPSSSGTLHGNSVTNEYQRNIYHTHPGSVSAAMFPFAGCEPNETYSRTTQPAIGKVNHTNISYNQFAVTNKCDDKPLHPEFHSKQAPVNVNHPVSPERLVRQPIPRPMSQPIPQPLPQPLHQPIPHCAIRPGLNAGPMSQALPTRPPNVIAATDRNQTSGYVLESICTTGRVMTTDSSQLVSGGLQTSKTSCVHEGSAKAYDNQHHPSVTSSYVRTAYIAAPPVLIMPGSPSATTYPPFVSDPRIKLPDAEPFQSSIPEIMQQLCQKSGHSFDTLIAVADQVQQLEDDVVKYVGKHDAQEYAYLEEMLTRQLLSLDQILAEGDEEIRSARRSLVREVQELLRILDKRAGG